MNAANVSARILLVSTEIPTTIGVKKTCHDQFIDAEPKWMTPSPIWDQREVRDCASRFQTKPQYTDIFFLHS